MLNYMMMSSIGYLKVWGLGMVPRLGGAIGSKSALFRHCRTHEFSLPTINFRICHPRSAFGNKAGHLVVLRRADHAVARSQHGFAAVCDVLSATLSARSRRQAPDDRARPSRSADGIARGLSGERIERTEPARRRADTHAAACAQHGFVAVRGVLPAAELVAPRRRRARIARQQRRTCARSADDRSARRSTRRSCRARRAHRHARRAPLVGRMRPRSPKRERRHIFHSRSTFVQYPLPATPATSRARGHDLDREGATW